MSASQAALLHRLLPGYYVVMLVDGSDSSSAARLVAPTIDTDGQGRSESHDARHRIATHRRHFQHAGRPASSPATVTMSQVHGAMLTTDSHLPAQVETQAGFRPGGRDTVTSISAWHTTTAVTAVVSVSQSE